MPVLFRNMSKKIRIYEKERGGAESFLSPRHSYGLASPRRNLMSSPSSKIMNHSALASQVRSFVTDRPL